MDNCSNSRANTCRNLFGVQLLELLFILMIHNNFLNRAIGRWIVQVSALSAGMLVYCTNMAYTGNGGLGSDSGEGA